MQKQNIKPLTLLYICCFIIAGVSLISNFNFNNIVVLSLTLVAYLTLVVIVYKWIIKYWKKAIKNRRRDH